MESANRKQGFGVSEIDFGMLMDLRVDYAFKLFFGTGDTSFLVSLLNAVFKNKKLPRLVKSLTVVNPFLEKQSESDKQSVLDIRAKLDDDSNALIEMHLYDILDLKYKTIRSWARAYGEDIEAGDEYSSQPPVICVAFVDGSVDKGESRKIHKCCKITDIDDCKVFSDALELHFIDMKAFAKTINETGDIQQGEAWDSQLGKWLALIAEKDIEDKSIIKGICEEEEEMGMAVSALVRLSEDKVMRQAYQKRQDEIMLHRRRDRRISELEAEVLRITDENARIAAESEEHKAIIAELRSQLEKTRNSHPV